MAPIELGSVHHIGVAVENMSAALTLYRDTLNMKVLHDETLASHGVRVVFLDGGGTQIELLESTSDTSAVGKFLKKRGEGLHHICYKVPDVHKTYARLVAQGFQPIDTSPRSGAHGATIAFFHPSNFTGVLTEILAE